MDGTATSPLDFLVRRDRLTEFKMVAAPERGPLAPGDVELAVDLFGLTANNITYAVTGDLLGYWKFFPHPEPPWGRIPVWGFGVVTRSTLSGIGEGDRYFGYFPMSTHLVTSPGRADHASFSDAAPHRSGLHAAYNRYRRVGAEPDYPADSELEQVILRPLFATSYLLGDLLVDKDFYGADTVVVSSASSKTAWCMAYLLGRRPHSRPIVGLTSPRSIDAVSRMGIYDRVLAYDDLSSLPASRPTAYVDFAGSAPVLAAVHHHFGGALRASLSVGFTHRDQVGVSADLPGPRPHFFFAPDRLELRRKEWTTAGLLERLAEAWRAILEPVRDPKRGWLQIRRGRGPAAIAETYQALATGQMRPEDGHVLSFR